MSISNNEELKSGCLLLGAKCSNKCVFCIGRSDFGEIDYDYQKREGERRIGIIEEVIKEHQKNDINFIEISGNDPIEEEKELVDTIRKIKTAGFSRVRVSTHGMNLHKEDYVRDLVLAGLDEIIVPIYGSTAEIHDSVTKNPGSFEKTVAGIKHFLSINPITVAITSLITEQNKNDVLDIIKFIEELNPNYFIISVPFVSHQDSSFQVHPEELATILKDSYQYILNNPLKRTFDIHFEDIPFCLFGEKNDEIIKFSSVPSLGGHIPEGIDFLENTPIYRVRKNIAVCDKCSAKTSCGGFNARDVEIFNLEKIKPL